MLRRPCRTYLVSLVIVTELTYRIIAWPGHSVPDPYWRLSDIIFYVHI